MATPTALWGEIRQLGYVIPTGTLHAAIERWVRVRGVGPWLLIEHPEVHDFVHRGTPGPLDFSIALAQAGELQIELIDQHDGSPSTYREFLDSTNGSGGLHHLAYWPDDMQAALAEAGALGYEVWTSGRIGQHGVFRYFLTQDHPGTVVEHAHITRGTREFFAELAQRSRRFAPATDNWFATR